MKRLLTMAVLCSLFALAAIACAPVAVPAPTQAPSTGPTTAAAAPTTAAPATNVTFADWGYVGVQQEPFTNSLAKPFEQKHPGVTVKLAGGRTADVIPIIKAAQGASPYDTIALGEPRILDAIADGWILPMDLKEIPNAKDANPALVPGCHGHGIPITYEVIGLMYDSTKVPAPESWMDMWKPEYKGKIGLASPASNLGFLYTLLLARLNGGDEANIEPAFAKLKELGSGGFIPVASPEALADAMSRGELSIGVIWGGNASVAMQNNPNLKFVLPKEGGIASQTCYAIVKGTANMELAKDWLNDMAGADFQTAFSRAPYFFNPANIQVQPTDEALEMSIAPNADQVKLLQTFDLVKANPGRAAMTDRFNKEFGQ